MVVKIGIVGTRSRDTDDDYHTVANGFITACQAIGIGLSEVHIVSGGCEKGADRFAELIAKSMADPITIYYPNWGKHGKKAGAIRNLEIAYESDWLIACVSPERKGGTEITIKEFIKQKGEDKLIIV